MNDAELVEQIRDQPDDDVVRLMLADVLEEHGDDRAELLRVQLELAGGRLSAARRQQLAELESELVRTQRRELLETLRPLGIQDIRFQRGLPEKVLIEGTAFLDRPLTLFRDLPVIRALMWRGLTSGNSGNALERLAELKQLRCLQALDLTGCNVRVGGIKALQTAQFAPVLQRLRLGQNHVYGEALEQLCECPLSALTELDLSRNELGEADVRRLVRAPLVDGLQVLLLAGNQLADDSLLKIANAPRVGRLRSLDLSGNQFGPEAIARWTESAALEQLKELSLSGNPLGPMGVTRLASASNCGRLTSLALAGCDLGADGLSALCGSPYLVHLLTLDLGRNDLGAAIEQLARLNAPELRELSVSGNSVRGGSLVRMLDEGSWKHLVSLDVSINQIDDRGIGSLLKSKTVRQLQTLNLSGNRLSLTGLQSVVDASAQSRWKAVDLRSNLDNSGVLSVSGSPVRWLLDR